MLDWLTVAEFILNANGTDWYDVSYVDGFDNPIGISVSNGSCSSPHACMSAPLTNCLANLASLDTGDIAARAAKLGIDTNALTSG